MDELGLMTKSNAGLDATNSLCRGRWRKLYLEGTHDQLLQQAAIAPFVEQLGLWLHD